MRFVLIAALALSVVGCTRWSMNHHLNLAYSAYDRGNCEQVTLELSKVERASRARLERSTFESSSMTCSQLPRS